LAEAVSKLALDAVALSRGSRQVIQDVSFSASSGELLAIMGASGSGKTTILRAVAGLEPIAAGTIEIDGVRLTPGGLPRGSLLRELHRRVGMVFQFHHLFAHMTALHNVWLAPVHVLGVSRADAERRAHELLQVLGVGDKAESMPHELSGGEAQRVAIARALAMDPPILLLDEPTASLDPERRAELAATLVGLAAGGRALILTSHDEDFVQRLAGARVLRISEGRGDFVAGRKDT